jgi:hypothetical protein
MELCTVDLESGASSRVASEEKGLEPQAIEYTSEHEFPLPELGRHELRTDVFLLLPGQRTASRRGPIVRVIP